MLINALLAYNLMNLGTVYDTDRGCQQIIVTGNTALKCSVPSLQLGAFTVSLLHHRETRVQIQSLNQDAVIRAGSINFNKWRCEGKIKITNE